MLNRITGDFDVSVLDSLHDRSRDLVEKMVEVIVNSLSSVVIARESGQSVSNPIRIEDGATQVIVDVFILGSVEPFVEAILAGKEDANKIANIILANELAEDKYESLFAQNNQQPREELADDIIKRLQEIIEMLRAEKDLGSAEYLKIRRFFKETIATMLTYGIGSGILTTGTGEH